MEENKRPGLTRQVLIETGLRLLDEVGLDGLTVRRLASELGVQSPALYWHIHSKQELLDEMADEIVVAAGMGPPGALESWQDWLSRRARAYRRSLLAHRDGARLVANAARLSPATIRMFDKELTIMVDRGFTPLQALRAISTVTYYVNGFVLQEQSERQQRAENPAALLAALPGLLDRGTSATLLVAIREGGSTVSEEAFERGLETLIEGIAAVRARTNPRGPA